MKPNTLLRAAALAAALLLGGAAPATAAPPAHAGASLYHLDTPLTDSLGRRGSLRELAGNVALVTMFYGDCNTACPVVIENLKRTVAALGAPGRKLKVLMVSLDPWHDSAASLARLAATHHLDTGQFKLAVAGDEGQTRLLAAALNIKFRVLGGGEINHTTRIALIDGDGVVLGASSRMDPEPDPEFVRRIAAALNGG